MIKHSQATKICISLTENNEQMVLEIIDNGIGFSPETVQQGLHVGLQSMQIRVQKIGGQFNLKSKSSRTIIQVILPRKIIDLDL